MAQRSVGDAIPIYTIDMSLEPEARYQEVAEAFGSRMRSLKYLFEDVLISMVPYMFFRRVLTVLARLLLHRVHDPEETLELRGISKIAGVEMYLLVALNTFLDCLLGCTSGAAIVELSKTSGGRSSLGASSPRMLHFRTLDWGMDGLRDLLVILEFVNSKKSGDRVLARSVTYVGFVGSLTAVRGGLSVSLNFRPKHVCPTRALRWHQSMVILGFRKSIGSVLRSLILRTSAPGDDFNLQKQANEISLLRTAPCYLVLCDGREVAVVEKDLTQARVRFSSQFAVHTNHDVDHPVDSNPKEYIRTSPLGNEEWLEESTHRMTCLERKWDRNLAKSQTIPRPDSALDHHASQLPGGNPGVCVREYILKRWMRASPTMNECTHFACLLDPLTGQIRWIQRGPDS